MRMYIFTEDEIRCIKEWVLQDKEGFDNGFWIVFSDRQSGSVELVLDNSLIR